MYHETFAGLRAANVINIPSSYIANNVSKHFGTDFIDCKVLCDGMATTRVQ